MNIAQRAVEGVWGWRRLYLGPPTAGYVATVMVSTSVHWTQLGAAVSWGEDEESHHVHARFGPLDLDVTIGRREELDALSDESSGWSRTVRFGDRDVYLYRIGRHLGATLDWGNIGGRVVVRAQAGPLGVVVEPVAGPLA